MHGIEFRGETAIIVSKLAKVVAAVANDPSGELKVEVRNRDGSFYTGYVSRYDGQTVILKDVIKYEPCKHHPGSGLDVYPLDRSIRVGVDRVSLTLFGGRKGS